MCMLKSEDPVAVMNSQSVPVWVLSSVVTRFALWLFSPWWHPKGQCRVPGTYVERAARCLVVVVCGILNCSVNSRAVVENVLLGVSVSLCVAS